MKRPFSLSEIEWQILKHLWEKGVLSVREVRQKLFPDGERAYTTIQTYMDRMVEKKLLKKEKIGLVNFYQPLVDKKSMRRKATDTLITKAFDGSFGSLAAFLVDSYNLSEHDLEKIKDLIKKKEGS